MTGLQEIFDGRRKKSCDSGRVAKAVQWIVGNIAFRRRGHEGLRGEPFEGSCRQAAAVLGMNARAGELTNPLRNRNDADADESAETPSERATGLFSGEIARCDDADRSERVRVSRGLGFPSERFAKRIEVGRRNRLQGQRGAAWAEVESLEEGFAAPVGASSFCNTSCSFTSVVESGTPLCVSRRSR